MTSTAWFARLPPDLRAAIRDLSPVRPRRNLIVLVFVALWGGSAALVLALPYWPMRLAGYVAMGASLHALGILMHEAVHGNFFRQRTRDRWAAFLLGVPILLSGSAYRVTHLLHHRFTRGKRDPDEFANYFHHRHGLALFFYLWGIVGLLVFLVHVPVNAWRRGTKRDRIAVLLEYGAIVLLYSAGVIAAVQLDLLPALLHVWLIPLAVSSAIVNVRGWSEHMLTQPGHPLTHTRTVTTNRIVRFLLCNLNYHLEHHLFPGIPWYNLPRVHVLLQDEYARAGTSMYKSYVVFLWDALRAGVHGQAPAPRKSQSNGATLCAES
jgi:fatty acid desaturase